VRTRKRRSWRYRIAEFLVWAAVAVGTAVLLVYLTERFAPPNF
jgi:hypothetical protein